MSEITPADTIATGLFGSRDDDAPPAAARVRLLDGETFYGRHGDVFALGYALGTVALLVRGGRGRG